MVFTAAHIEEVLFRLNWVDTEGIDGLHLGGSIAQLAFASKTPRAAVVLWLVNLIALFRQILCRRLIVRLLLHLKFTSNNSLHISPLY